MGHPAGRLGRARRRIPGLAANPLWLRGEGVMGANALYASLFIPEVARLDLTALPSTQLRGPIYLHVLRHLDLPQAVALAGQNARA